MHKLYETRRMELVRDEQKKSTECLTYRRVNVKRNDSDDDWMHDGKIVLLSNWNTLASLTRAVYAGTKI